MQVINSKQHVNCFVGFYPRCLFVLSTHLLVPRSFVERQKQLVNRKILRRTSLCYCFSCFSGCEYGGVVHQSGETWSPGPCVPKCQCLNGFANCSKVECPDLNCDKPMKRRWKCCPECLPTPENGEYLKSFESSGFCLLDLIRMVLLLLLLLLYFTLPFITSPNLSSPHYSSPYLSSPHLALLYLNRGAW